jgi:hypothetical protein
MIDTLLTHAGRTQDASKPLLSVPHTVSYENRTKWRAFVIIDFLPCFKQHHTSSHTLGAVASALLL